MNILIYPRLAAVTQIRYFMTQRDGKIWKHGWGELLFLFSLSCCLKKYLWSDVYENVTVPFLLFPCIFNILVANPRPFLIFRSPNFVNLKTNMKQKLQKSLKLWNAQQLISINSYCFVLTIYFAPYY